jgi:hypothetical protein
MLSHVVPKVLKLSSEVSECKPLVLGIGLAVGVQQLLRHDQARDGEAGDKPRTPAARLHDFNSNTSKSRGAGAGAGAGADVPQEVEDDEAGTCTRSLFSST